jgi:hypothetical protein
MGCSRKVEETRARKLDMLVFRHSQRGVRAGNRVGKVQQGGLRRARGPAQRVGRSQR